MALNSEYFRSVDVNIKLMLGGITPKRGSTGACAYDLYAASGGSIGAGKRGTIPTGVCVGLPSGYYAKIESRSGLASNYGLIALGTICDSDYRGEYKVMLFNSGDKDFEYHRGDRIAQLIILKHEVANFEVVDNLEETDRGIGGFGSSGK